MAEERAPTYCPKHSETPTNLRCSRCDKPVCPECMVQAPVGIRCQEHGQPAKLPTYDVSAGYIVRGVTAGVGIGVLGGLVLGRCRSLHHPVLDPIRSSPWQWSAWATSWARA